MVTEENVLSKAYSLNSQLNALAIFQNIRPFVRRGGVSPSNTFLDQNVKATLILIVLITCSCNLIDWSSVRIAFAIWEFLFLFAAEKSVVNYKKAEGFPRFKKSSL